MIKYCSTGYHYYKEYSIDCDLLWSGQLFEYTCMVQNITKREKQINNKSYCGLMNGIILFLISDFEFKRWKQKTFQTKAIDLKNESCCANLNQYVTV